MLPAAAYLEPEVLAWEREHLFAGWRCVGRGEDVAAGSMTARDLGGHGMLLVRDEGGELRAFHNACRHRGHELLPCGQTAEAGRAITCPYHAWSYRPDGSLVAAPGFTDLDRAAFGLRPLRVAEWHGWAFVDASGDAPGFDEHVGDLASYVEAYDAGSLVTVVRHAYDVAANWKVVIENYQECYHCPMIHPELCEVTPPDSGDNVQPEGAWMGGLMDLRENAETMSLDGRSGGVTLTRLDEQQQRSVMYNVVLPNLLISLHPDYVMSHLMTPLTPDLTRIECSWAFSREAVERCGFDPAYAVDFWDLTNRQDWAACESVQRGMHTPGYEPGPIAPREDGVHQFVSRIARAYLG